MAQLPDIFEPLRIFVDIANRHVDMHLTNLKTVTETTMTDLTTLLALPMQIAPSLTLPRIEKELKLKEMEILEKLPVVIKYG